MSADAPVWHHVWADEATKKAMAEAVRDAVRAAPVGRSTDDLWPELVDAVLSVLPDPTADTVLLAKVREIVDGERPAGYTSFVWQGERLRRIAALLAGGS